MTTTYIAIAEFVSALFLLVIAVNIALRRGTNDRSTRFFFFSVAFTILGGLTDAFSYVLDGIAPVPLLFVFNLFSFLSIDLMIIPFVFYVWSFLSDKNGFPLPCAYIVTGCCGVEILLIIIFSCTGALFMFDENGLLIYKDFCQYAGTIALLMAVFLAVVLVSRVKIIGWKNIVIFSFYLLFPAIGSSIQILLQSESLLYVMISIVLSTVYISLQSGEIDKGHLRERIMLEMSNTDALTGLNNRRAYEQRLEAVSADLSTGVLFCDLNGLKRTNDTYGHAAGDELILRFSNLIGKCFSASEIFRISGDEFVVIKQNIGADVFMAQVARLRQKIKQNDDIASVGAYCGKGENTLELVRNAEKEMYVEKRMYYETRGYDRRK